MLWVDGETVGTRLRLNLTSHSASLNPSGRYYNVLKSSWNREYEDNYWAEDAIFMERNSRDFVSRIDRTNYNSEAICGLLVDHPRGSFNMMHYW
jgi:cystathionine gamma-synthase